MFALVLILVLVLVLVHHSPINFVLFHEEKLQYSRCRYQ